MDTDLWTEDNFAIKYVCNCLQQSMKNYQKEYYGLYIKGSKDKIKYKRCKDCGKMFFVNSIVKNKKRCDECQHIKQLEYQRNSMKKLRNK